ncbi:hypothetical protein RA29_11440 [Tateyamaria sp. ANG-S1]|nr:hypothetical protein RA29_11440 [Tateyamaria sp. ANG-S1]
MKQVEAYGAAGYRQSASGASRMANEPEIRARVEELRQERWMAREGIDVNDPRSIPWLGQAYVELFQAARKARKFGEAVKALENITKLIHFEERVNQTAASKPVAPSDKINLEDMLGVIDRVCDIASAANDNAARQSVPMVQIPPNN